MPERLGIVEAGRGGMAELNVRTVGAAVEAATFVVAPDGSQPTILSHTLTPLMTRYP